LQQVDLLEATVAAHGAVYLHHWAGLALASLLAAKDHRATLRVLLLSYHLD